MTRLPHVFVLLLLHFGMLCISSSEPSQQSLSSPKLSSLRQSITQNINRKQGKQKKKKKQETVDNQSVHDGAMYIEWSKWSTCSRSCDGGVSSRDRHCFRTSKFGKKVRCKTETSELDMIDRKKYPNRREYKICNIQPCSSLTSQMSVKSFRTQQCSQHNNSPYKGRYYNWEEYLDETRPCVLMCKSTNDATVAQFADHVLDGTRCRKDSLDMCIDGQCKRVGCDLKIGSTRKIDACGVCSEESDEVDKLTKKGKSCKYKEGHSFFNWVEIPLSHCSAPCGGGHMMARSVCRNNKTRTTVNDEMCDMKKRSPPRMAPCNTKACPARWEVDDWGPCSKTCGGGFKERKVSCVSDRGGKKIKVLERSCPDLKPTNREACLNDNCPQWFTGIWSECSVKCGQGVQDRNVICRDSRGIPSGACNDPWKPVSRQPCTGPKKNCKNPSKGTKKDGKLSSLADQEKKDKEIKDKNSEVTDNVDSGKLSNKGWKKLGSATLSPDVRSDFNEQKSYSNSEKQRSGSSNQRSAPLPSMQRMQQQQQIPNEPTFIVKDWGECSVPCGEGIRVRDVQCQIFLEFSKTVANLPDDKCPGPKPITTEICYAGLCDTRTAPLKEKGNYQSEKEAQNAIGSKDDLNENSDDHLLSDEPTPQALMQRNQPQRDGLIKAMALQSNYDRNRGYQRDADDQDYEWKDAGWTTCTSSCLGGVQETKIICVESQSGSHVAPMHCGRSKERPDVEVRTCNDIPCPPRWDVSNFTSCTKTCGSGIQKRGVNCIQEVRHGANNILQVDHRFCPSPAPIAQQYCNIIDCPMKWVTGSWTKCSMPCGGGVKHRKIHCRQRIALGDVADKPPEHCSFKKKPDAERACNLSPCSAINHQPAMFGGSKNAGTIKANINQNYIQPSWKLKTVRLKVGGRATVYEGTKIKIRCPVKKFKRSSILWVKENKRIPIGKKGQRERRKRRRRKHIKKKKGVYAGNAFVTKKGTLQIKKTEIKDGGLYTCMAKKSKATIELIINTQPDKYKQNEVWYNGGLDNENIGNHVDTGFGEKDPLREINSYNHGLPDDNGKNNLENSNNNHFRTSYEYEPHDIDNGVDEYKDSNLMYGPSEKNRNINDQYTNALNDDMNKDNYPHNSYASNDRGFDKISYGYQTTTSTTLESRWPTFDEDPMSTNYEDHGNHAEHQGSNQDLEYQPYDDNRYNNAISDREYPWEEIGQFGKDHLSTSAESILYMHNRRDRLSADMKGTVEIGASKQSNNERSTENIMDKKKENDVTETDDNTSVADKNTGISSTAGDDDGNEDSHRSVVVGDQERLQLDWRISEWSRCSQTCGPNGKQIRTIECILVKSGNFNWKILETQQSSRTNDQSENKADYLQRVQSAHSLPDSLCVDSGMDRPQSEKSCGMMDCPSWIAPSWAPCEQSKCIAINTGFQTRAVFCGSKVSNQAMDEKYCEAVLKPTSSQTCHNRKCKGSWKIGDWSECEQSCDEELGVKRRDITCVWKGSNDTAGEGSCRKRNHPEAVTTCHKSSLKLECKDKEDLYSSAIKTPLPRTILPRNNGNSLNRDSGVNSNTNISKTSLRSNSAISSNTSARTAKQLTNCLDHSKYCGLVHHFKMCGKEKYKIQCCKSCVSKS